MRFFHSGDGANWLAGGRAIAFDHLGRPASRCVASVPAFPRAQRLSRWAAVLAVERTPSCSGSYNFILVVVVGAGPSLIAGWAGQFGRGAWTRLRRGGVLIHASRPLAPSNPGCFSPSASPGLVERFKLFSRPFRLWLATSRLLLARGIDWPSVASRGLRTPSPEARRVILAVLVTRGCWGLALWRGILSS